MDHCREFKKKKRHALVSAKKAKTVHPYRLVRFSFFYSGDKRDQGKKVRHRHSKITSHLNNSLSLNHTPKGAKDKPKLYCFIFSASCARKGTRHFGIRAHAATERPQDPAQRPCHGRCVYLRLYSQTGHGRGPHTQAPP